ncbi:putative F-box protein At1g57580 [Eutrema salsugineum]|nr:putative F-box protein At1g57580 [Eutrema salsugineum]
MRVLLGASDNHLTLISATMEMIYVFTLESILTDPKWILAKRIMNEAVQKNITLSWDVEAYDGKCIVVRTMTNLTDYQMVNGYDLRVNKWDIVGSLPSWCDGLRDFYQYKPSWSSVIGLTDQEDELYHNLFIVKYARVLAVEGIIRFINHNICI